MGSAPPKNVLFYDLKVTYFGEFWGAKYKALLYPKAVTYTKIGQHAEGVDGMGQRMGLRLSERGATNIGLLYPKVRNNIGGIFPLTSPNQNIGGMCPRRG